MAEPILIQGPDNHELSGHASSPDRRQNLSMRALIRIGHFLSQVATVLEPHIKLTTLAAVVAVAGFIITNYVGSLQQQHQSLTASVEAERTRFQEELRTRDKIIHDLLPASLRAPVPISPQNGSTLVGRFVILEWQETSETPHTNYIVEIIKPGPNASESLGTPETLLATNPRNRSTRYPIKLDVDIPVGAYLWRVVPGDIRDNQTILDGNWSGYYRFTIYWDVVERIKATHTLRVGVSYIQDSDFMRRDDKGKPWGFDYELISAVARDLGGELGIKQPLKVEIVDYPTIETTLYEGLLKGEVDVAIGSITKAQYRERSGVSFTNGYFQSHLILVAKRNARFVGLRHLTSKTKIGVVRGTTNERAALYLKKKFTFELIPKESFQDLVKSLEFRDLDFIIIDEPLARPLVARGTFVTVTHLSDYLGQYYSEEIGYPDEEYAVAAADSLLSDKMNKILSTAAMHGLVSRLRADFKLQE